MLKKVFLFSLISLLFNSGVFAETNNEEMFFKGQELENKLKALTAQFENMEIKNKTLESELKKTKLDYEFRLKELEDTNSSLNSQVNNLQSNISEIKKSEEMQKVEEIKKTEKVTVPVAVANEVAKTDEVKVPLAVAENKPNIILDNTAAIKPVVQNENSDLVFDKVAENNDEPYGGTPNRHYQSIHTFLDSGNYVEAEKAIKAFIEKYPEHNFTPNAYYWLGETYYVQKQYEKASVAFADAYRRYPNHEKAGANILKIGFSMERLGKNSEACQAFNSIIKGEIVTNSDLITMAQGEAKKIGC